MLLEQTYSYSPVHFVSICFSRTLPYFRSIIKLSVSFVDFLILCMYFHIVAVPLRGGGGEGGYYYQEGVRQGGEGGISKVWENGRQYGSIDQKFLGFSRVFLRVVCCVKYIVKIYEYFTKNQKKVLHSLTVLQLIFLLSFLPVLHLNNCFS